MAKEYTVRVVKDAGHTSHICTGFGSFKSAQDWADRYQCDYSDRLVVMDRKQYDREEKILQKKGRLITVEYTIRAVKNTGHTGHVCTGFGSFKSAQDWADRYQCDYSDRLVIMDRKRYDREEKKLQDLIQIGARNQR